MTKFFKRNYAHYRYIPGFQIDAAIFVAVYIYSRGNAPDTLIFVITKVQIIECRPEFKLAVQYCII